MRTALLKTADSEDAFNRINSLGLASGTVNDIKSIDKDIGDGVENITVIDRTGSENAGSIENGVALSGLTKAG